MTRPARGEGDLPSLASAPEACTMNAGSVEGRERTSMIAATLKRPALATIGGAPGLLLSVSETAQGALYRKWIGVFGATRASVAILATFPEALAEELSEPLKRNVVSAR